MLKRQVLSDRFRAMKDRREVGSAIRESELNLVPPSCGLSALWSKASVLQQRYFKAVEEVPECQRLAHVK